MLTDPEKRKQYDLYGSDEDRLSSDLVITLTQEVLNQIQLQLKICFSVEISVSPMFTFAKEADGKDKRLLESHIKNIHIIESNKAITRRLFNYCLFYYFFISDPAYSLQVSTTYAILRKTANLNIAYYVKDNFNMEYQGSVKRLEMSVEEDYIKNIKTRLPQGKKLQGIDDLESKKFCGPGTVP